MADATPTTPSTPSAPAAPAAAAPSPAPASPSPATATQAAPSPAASPQPSAPAVAKDRLSSEDVKQGMLAAAKTSLLPKVPAPDGKTPGIEPNGSVKAEPEAEDPAKKKAAEADEGEDDDKTPLPEVDENSLPFDQRQVMRRWKRTLDRTRKELTAAAPKAEQFEKIQSYMDQFHLTSDQVALGFDVMAKLNTNPQLAYAALRPIMDELEERLGVKLSPDLQQRVEQGLVDPKTASELARTRGQQQFTEEDRQRAIADQQRQQQAQVIGTIHRAVAQWDAQKTEKDPDFARKREMVEDAARSIMAREGKATNPQAAIAVLDRALQMVEARLNPFRPNGAPTLRQPASTGAPATTVAPQPPKDIREAALQGLNGTYRFQQ